MCIIFDQLLDKNHQYHYLKHKVIYLAIRRENDLGYASIWRSIVNFIKHNSGFSVGGVARAGSRRHGTYDADSDLDIIFWIAGDPPKNQVYPRLVEKLTSVLNVQAWIGGSYNVINIKKDTLEIDLVLRTKSDFDSQVQRDKLERL